MEYIIDTSWSKLVNRVGQGYSRRTITRPTSMVIHTTNGNKGSSFAGEARFLRNSPDVSAHYLIGKSGQIAEILPPSWQAWHAGVARSGYSNNQSIGIECHHAVGETWPLAQIAALTWLTRMLMDTYTIPLERIETHRAIALPAGRKVDPSDWSDSEFYAWRQGLDSAPQDAQVIGIKPRATLQQFQASMQANRAPLSPEEQQRIYTLAMWLEIGPAFFIALWAHEGGRPFGSSPLQLRSRCPINIKAAPNEWRDTVTHNGEKWLAFESFQLGALHSLVHLKQVHGAHGRLTVRSIIPVHAPASDGNDPETFIQSVLQDMGYIRSR